MKGGGFLNINTPDPMQCCCSAANEVREVTKEYKYTDPVQQLSLSTVNIISLKPSLNPPPSESIWPGTRGGFRVSRPKNFSDMIKFGLFSP